MTGPGAPRPSSRIAWGAAVAAVAAAILCAFLLLDTGPSAEWQDRTVTVPRGSRMPEVVSALREGGVLRRPLVFRALVYLSFTSRRLHYGEYTFTRPPSTFEVWQKVIHGDVVTYKVTVPAVWSRIPVLPVPTTAISDFRSPVGLPVLTWRVVPAPVPSTCSMDRGGAAARILL